MQWDSWRRHLGYNCLMTICLLAHGSPAPAREPAYDARQARPPAIPLAFHQAEVLSERASTSGVPPTTPDSATRLRRVDWPAPSAGNSPDFAALLLRLVLGTGFAVGTCVALLWWARRGGLTIGPRTTGQETMRLVETLCLPNRCCLYLVKVNDHGMLIGCDASGLKHIGYLPESFSTHLALEEGRENASENRRAGTASGDPWTRG